MYLESQIKTALQKFGQAGGSLRASTRPTLNLLPLLRASGPAVTLKVPGKSAGTSDLGSSACCQRPSCQDVFPHMEHNNSAQVQQHFTDTKREVDSYRCGRADVARHVTHTHFEPSSLEVHGTL